MRYIFIILPLVIISMGAQAQDDVSAGLKDHSFKKENLFTGGNIIASFFTGGIVLGANPHLGYSVTRWLDVAVTASYNYTGETDEYGTRYRQHVFAPGTFVRVFPIDILFLQAQYEHNFLKLTTTEQGIPSYKYSSQANSLLVGGGYAQGREGGSNSFFYISLMYDILDQPNSPYRDAYGRLIPVVTVGFNIALFQGSGRHR